MELTTELGIAYGALLLMALLPIWIGSHWSLKQQGIETMSTQDAWMFPIVGSGVLFGLYLLFKLFSKEYINLLLTGYFLFFGLLALSATIIPLIGLILPSSVANTQLFILNLTMINKSWKDMKVRVVDLLGSAASVGIVAWYVLGGKHWIANNVLGLAFAVQGISFLSVGSYKIGCILLTGLFFYDIFWVFGTDVMVSVAKSFDAPIKLLFPKNIFGEVFQFSMLGLGDIVLPGVFIALLLRFDAKRRRKSDKSFSKPYFNTCFVGYILGLATTMAVMHIFQHAQPALLYLVPACIGSSFMAAVVRNEVGLLFNYSEEPKPSKKDKKKDNTTTTNTSKTANTTAAPTPAPAPAPTPAPTTTAPAPAKNTNNTQKGTSKKQKSH